MHKSVARVAELKQLRGHKIEEIQGTFWTRYQQAAMPIGPIQTSYKLSKATYQQVLKRLSCQLLQATTGFQEQSSWYAVINQQFTDLDLLSTSTRSKIRRGLKRSTVDQVDASYMAKHGYETYVAAFERYADAYQAYSEKEFKAHISASKSFDDVTEYFVVHHEKKVVAWSSNLVFGDKEANYTAIKLNPNYLKHYTSYALIHTMNEHYLKLGKVELVNDGFRSLVHDSAVQAWLMDKFKFEKRGLGLELAYSSLFGVGVKTLYPMREGLSNLHPKLKALMTLEQISRQNKKRAQFSSERSSK